MDRARIEAEYRAALDNNISPLGFAEHIAKLARAEALEEAAKVCTQYGLDVDNSWNRSLGVAGILKEVADDCAEQILELKKLGIGG
ncbi:MAG: hypothetical protein ACXWT4_06095 [Methylobacter sp.]